MCELYIRADPIHYENRTRSLRIHGAVTTIRLENMFWEILTDIAAADDLTVNQLITKLSDEVTELRGELPNVASFLRVSCLQYLKRERSIEAVSGPKAGHPIALRRVG
ncbi:ribbon-helix-helix domain-containing protein [Acetobacter persici]|jgi:predicted DNA-binding ribbon-helix-helix protein|uniref:ribbon-helix-helix domain-containing protein n=2 Tax=Acetobacteraceae TaxID=433 RepID=UPI0020CF338C|nr:ribbon-helix-helix domain-containing protein [Acetobacter persici]MCH4023296.1 ribbon-helix-helix domain-containing protein [Acetobacter sp.]MCH4061284.1 ribbon-helix-helix domain-containing protein [Acetobacter sp.]MCH4088221.1 ribbon-helix-helix domain-containing protein [Acetobacter sp.]MCI1295050.1 ribbon-helix-helix domain-containing protein [Acetobacter sp.]MCI1375047.1 ribbon-helix-helix domain-containing protein [Acetobacter sp.]